MSSYFWISYALLWLLVVGIAVLVLMLLREIGRAYLNSDEQRADPNKTGPKLNTQVPRLPVRCGATESLLEEVVSEYPYSLVLVTKDNCPICPKAAAAVGGWTRRSQVVAGILLANPGEHPYHSEADYITVTAEHEVVEEALGIRFVPFGLLIDRSGRVLSKGIVNDEVDIDRLTSRVPQQVHAEIARDFAHSDLAVQKVTSERP
jgi:hypothetical protein